MSNISNHWSQAVAALSSQNVGYVLITVLKTNGSAPRGVQSKMVVTRDSIYDSIGGGNLEFDATQKAHDLLAVNQAAIKIQSYTLGQDLTQCCGGQVELLFESFPATDFNIVLFGAGHVGRELVKILSGLPCTVHWLDSRDVLLTEAVESVGAAHNIHPQVMHRPLEAVEQCPKQSYYLIMTHSHEIDFELCEAILARKDIRYCGLIGSKSKAAKFRSRLKRKSYTTEEINHLTSPMGLDLGNGKRPMEVAVSIAAQLLSLNSQAVDAEVQSADKIVQIV